MRVRRPRLRWHYNRDITSDGMTVDIAAGPVDLVAIDRALTGHPIRLSPAETAHLNDALDGSIDQARVIAAALGIHEDTVLRRYDRRNARRRAAPQPVAELASPPS